MIRDHEDPTFHYPSKNAFTEENIWLLWQQSKGQQPALPPPLPFSGLVTHRLCTGC